jgi:predicted O-methyltransferase YrrM
MSYKFTTDWFHWAPEVWLKVAAQMPSRKNFLEIGSFEGRSTVWTVENIMEDGGEIVCIDTWEGGEEHAQQKINMNYVEQNFDHNMRVLKDNFQNRWVVKQKNTSVEALPQMILNKNQFDFIYIDGSHQAPDVITDACLAWPLLKAGGVMVFDDYDWGEPLPPTHKPKMAIDAFMKIYDEKIHLVHKAYQLIIQKMKD